MTSNTGTLKCIHKPIVVLTDQNEVTINLSSEVRSIKKMELVYFKLMHIDLTAANIPENLFLRISETQAVPTDQIVASNNISRVVASSFGRIRNDTVPLHYKPAIVTIDPAGPGVPVTSPVLFGKQPKGMRWKAYDVSNLSNFKVTLLGFNGQPFPFNTVTGTTMELVFDVEWGETVNQAMNWKTDHVYMNSMNS